MTRNWRRGGNQNRKVDTQILITYDEWNTILGISVINSISTKSNKNQTGKDGRWRANNGRAETMEHGLFFKHTFQVFFQISVSWPILETKSS